MTNDGRVSTRTQRILKRLDTVALVVGSSFVAVFTAIVIYVVFSRYFLSSTPRWAEEVPRLLLVWVTFIGTTSAFCRNSHFNAGLLNLIVRKGRARSIVRRLSAGLVTIFLLVLIVTGWKLTFQTWSNTTTALSWPVGLFYLALPVCCSLSLIPAISHIFADPANDD